jgi:tRNA threonylcarbamoyladenosine biosynthesis protein TsaE
VARIGNHTFYSADQTISFGYDFGSRLSDGSIVCLFGDLGAGKTTFAKGLAAGAAGIDIQQVNSPTFVYLNIYQGRRTVYHFDLYRLNNADEFLSMGFDEMLFSNGICCIEWSERIASLLPPGCIKITLDHLGETSRVLRIEE